VHLFALRNETVSLQVVVQADAAAIDGVTVDLASLACAGGGTIANTAGATDPTSFVGRPIERFVEHYFDVTRASGGSDPTASLGWRAGSGPPADEWTGAMPDALLPVEAAPTWEPYPMRVTAQSNAVVWVDVTVPKNQGAGTCTGEIVVSAGGGAQTLARIPVELDVVAATLPERALATMLFYDPSELSRRIGDAAAEEHLWKLLHRHRLSALHDATSAADVTAQLGALDGSLYTAAHGYEGPGEAVGDGILSIGTYGSLGAPSASKLTTVEAIADTLAAHSLFASTDVFVYAIDETCGSPYGAGWKSLLGGSTDPNAKNVLVGWTCSDDPSTQPVDVPMILAGHYDPALVAAARSAGKRPWIYNGTRPHTDAFLTDTAAVAPRANAWIAAAAGIERWFYWETTFWYDDNRGGHGPYDPFVTAETFHNSDGDYCEGDGVLLYPGKQVDMFPEHSAGMSGVFASVRLKNLRRGAEDAGYYALAHAAAPARAEQIAGALLGATLSQAHDGKPVGWPETGARWFEARAALLAEIPRDATAGPDAGAAGDGGGGGADAGVSSGAGAGAGAGPGAGAGADAGAGSGADASAGAGSDAGGAEAEAPLAAGSSGCGCDEAGAGPRGGALLAFAIALALGLTLRRARPRLAHAPAGTEQTSALRDAPPAPARRAPRRDATRPERLRADSPRAAACAPRGSSR
jgi:hypothetical protein